MVLHLMINTIPTKRAILADKYYKSVDLKVVQHLFPLKFTYMIRSKKIVYWWRDILPIYFDFVFDTSQVMHVKVEEKI